MQNFPRPGRRNDWHPQASVCVCPPAEVRDLGHQKSALLMKKGGELFKEWNDVIVDYQLIKNRRCIDRYGSGASDEGKPNTALGFFHLVPKRSLCCPTVNGVTQSMAAAEDSVFDDPSAKIKGLK